MTLDNEELERLIARCAIRDERALQVLYEGISGYLNAIIFRIVKSDRDAEDVLQEAFVQIWLHADAYRPHLAKPMTWITSIARYRALDRLDKEMRQQKKLHSSTSDDVDLESIADPNSSPDVSFDHLQMEQNLQECLATLSAKAEQCINLAYLDGYSREEIAEKFNTNINTVKSWLHRGSERLRKCLEMKKAQTT